MDFSAFNNKHALSNELKYNCKSSPNFSMSGSKLPYLPLTMQSMAKRLSSAARSAAIRLQSASIFQYFSFNSRMEGGSFSSRSKGEGELGHLPPKEPPNWTSHNFLKSG